MKWVGKKTKCSEFGASVDCMFALSALTFALWQAGRSPWTQDQLQDRAGAEAEVFSLSDCIE